MALLVTEEWIRRRVELKEQRLADVRSLFLPGSYEEKITHLGKSLENFTRLKTLDLSRNSLVTSEGIQHLIHLEKLNLYYNKIASLKDIFLLRNLSSLKELDLRLNPVSKNESDYRLFVVHMLPNLRSLDDRPIRDSERKAALMHFSTDQACEFHDYPAQQVENESRSNQDPRAASNVRDVVADENRVQGKGRRRSERPRAEKVEGQMRRRPGAGDQARPRHPRAEFVNSLTKKCSGLDEDDEAVLNLIAKCGWDLNKPTGISGSAKSAPEAKLHNLQGIREIDDAARSQEPATRNTLQSTRSLPVNIPKTIVNSPRKGSEEYPALPSASSPRSRAISCGKESTARCGRVTFADDKPREFPPVDPNLKFQDEAEAYHRVTSRPHFTPHPGSSYNPPAPGHHLPRSTASCTLTVSLPANEVNGEKLKAGDQPVRPVHGQPSEMPNLLGERPSAVPPAPASRHTHTEELHVRRQPGPQKPGEEDGKSNGTRPRDCGTVPLMSSDVLSTECPAVDANFFNPNVMNSFLDLVDRYWNGFKSLHYNENFLSEAKKMMCAMKEQVALENQPKETKKLQEGMNNLKAKNESLETCLCQQKQQYTEEFQKLSIQLTQAQRDMETLKDCLSQTLDEKNHLQNHLIKLEQKALNASSSSTQQVEELQSQNQKLQCEIDNLKHQVQCYTKIQELTDMLQESHRALVCTNEHLLRELSETRARHKAEVEQLHWSYVQLKKTLEQPPRSTTITTSGSTLLGREIKSHAELEQKPPKS
ncbi:centrosomal protein of 72 kDa [Scyliorhinus canicula]|uniref:centrosomal protein of 72 kDa n=1 Tax=Scyliorhinus canicula TaxID=7830 RepID=UPI0018F72D1A|nr:centrosomal protein of 72 kDa [Scyliorhinus canicula]